MHYEKFGDNGIQIPGLGIFITFGRMEEHDNQPYVCINTEEAPAEDIAPDGEPILEVMLNDAILYDGQITPEK